jgi:hypothetical protein
MLMHIDENVRLHFFIMDSKAFVNYHSKTKKVKVPKPLPLEFKLSSNWELTYIVVSKTIEKEI